MNHRETPLAPTAEAIDAWLARERKFNADGSQKFAGEYAHYGVNIWTKSSEARCIVGRVVAGAARPGGWVVGDVGYETIKGEGSSNGCRRYIIWAPQIVRAEGWIVGEDPSIPELMAGGADKGVCSCGDTSTVEASGLCIACLDGRDGRCRECHGQGSVPWADGSGRLAPCDWCDETGTAAPPATPEVP